MYAKIQYHTNPYEIKNYIHIHTIQILEETIQEMVPSHRVGALLLLTEKLRLALAVEANTWKLVYGRALNEKCARQMDNTLEFFGDMEKKLSRPVKDLDDIRSHMKVFKL